MTCSNMKNRLANARHSMAGGARQGTSKGTWGRRQGRHGKWSKAERAQVMERGRESARHGARLRERKAWRKAERAQGMAQGRESARHGT